MNNPIPSMKSGSPTAGGTRWTLADFLSTYRYWALFLASLFMAFGGPGLNSVLPLISHTIGASYQSIGVFYVGSECGWVIGAFLAFIVASRRGRAAVVPPLVICGIVAACLLPMPALWGSPVFLGLLGLAIGTVRAVFPLAATIFLVGGRPGKIDFACALTLLSVSLLASAISPLGVAQLLDFDPSGRLVVWGFLACLLLALLVLMLARHIAFDDVPRPRHKPLPPRQRSPLLVALFVLAMPIAVTVMLLLAVIDANFPELGLFDHGRFIAVAAPALILLLGVVALCGVIYLAYWTYRVHGELAGAAPSQRLLTPLAAMLIAILVPLGLPILLMTLGDLLNDRVRDKGWGGAISITWLGVWCFLLPPIAVAMIQNAANKSYTSSTCDYAERPSMK